MPVNFQRIFDEYSESTKRQWAHDRTKTIGASEAFQCLRRNFFMKRGGKPDAGYEESYGATTRGNLIENNYVVPALRSQLPKGAGLLWAGDDQITLVKDRLSATPDGLMTNLPRDALQDYGIDDILGDEILVEIKSFDSRIDLSEPKPIHVGQVQQQMGLVWETTNHRPEYAVILYVNAAWVDDIRPFVVKRDPEVYAACKKRADAVYSASSAKDLLPEGKLRGGGECAYCPFAKQCSVAQVGRVPQDDNPSTLTKPDEVVLRKLIDRQQEIAAKLGALDDQKTAITEELKQFLEGQGKRFAKTSDGYTVTWSRQDGRKSFDIKRIVEDTGIDLEEYTDYGAPSERLTVKVPK